MHHERFVRVRQPAFGWRPPTGLLSYQTTFMKPAIFAFSGLLLAASAQAQTVTPKPGTSAPLTLQATVTTENAPTSQPLPNGASRKTYTVATVRLGNKEILESMRVASLLDGSVTGWTLSRLANPASEGNLYAIKTGKPAVAVPANLLTQPTVLAKADTGTVTKAANGTEVPNITRNLYTNFSVLNGATSSAGTFNLRASNIKIGAVTTIVQTRVETINFIGKGSAANSVMSGSYRIQRAIPSNLGPYFPGSTVP